MNFHRLMPCKGSISHDPDVELSTTVTPKLPRTYLMVKIGWYCICRDTWSLPISWSRVSRGTWSLPGSRIDAMVVLEEFW
uniref:Uncharacterized protein n=1 Tax=Setaria italica TaxID=4555 RepID=K3ZBC6_SETIT